MSVFDDALAQGIRSGQVPARTQKARTWYRNVAKGGAQPDMSEKGRTRTGVEPGSMYMFQYDPKHKATLPFYDKFPLIFPFDTAPGGFYGINLHYLPHRLRALLMDGLYKYTTDKNYDDQTKLKINYQVLKGAANIKMFQPCVKRYLNSHVRSNFIYVYPSEWDVALFLPTEQFEKKSMRHVHDASTRALYGAK